MFAKPKIHNGNTMLASTIYSREAYVQSWKRASYTTLQQKINNLHVRKTTLSQLKRLLQERGPAMLKAAISHVGGSMSNLKDKHTQSGWYPTKMTNIRQESNAGDPERRSGQLRSGKNTYRNDQRVGEKFLSFDQRSAMSTPRVYLTATWNRVTFLGTIFPWEGHVQTSCTSWYCHSWLSQAVTW